MADGRFAVDTERLGVDGAALRLVGEFDMVAVPTLDAALHRVARWSVSSLLVDAADVGFLDLTVAGRLAAAHVRLDAAGGGLLVINPPDCLLRLLDVLDELELPILR